MKTNYRIDIVLTWVDGSDPKWREQRNIYDEKKGNKEQNDYNVRYRDWDNLKYIFRGIEKNMPWVEKIHFVTWGHLPKWLNESNPKLNIVNHDQFIPREYLPTFNSSAIQVNLFRIPNLSERFINFNDDMFVIRPTRPEDFFVNGLPCDIACISPQPIRRETIHNVEFNNLMILNTYYSTKDIRRNMRKWICPMKYGEKAIRTLLFMHFNSIIGIFEQHIPFSYLKSEIKKVWELEFEVLDATSKNKFRSVTDVNEWLFRMFQLLDGKFVPRNVHFGRLVSASDVLQIKRAISDVRCKLICINDDKLVSDFEKSKEEVNELLEKMLPEKSTFEL